MSKQTVTKTEIQTEEPLEVITKVVEPTVPQVQAIEQTTEDEELVKMQSLKEKAIARNEKRLSEMARLISEQPTEKVVAKDQERN